MMKIARPEEPEIRRVRAREGVEILDAPARGAVAKCGPPAAAIDVARERQRLARPGAIEVQVQLRACRQRAGRKRFVIARGGP